MIKVKKDFTDIPASLIPAFEDLFPERAGRRIVVIPQQSNTTHSKRMEVINSGAYTDSENFNSRYKQADIRVALNNIYKGKCAFCEQKEEVTHVEHYRPKKKYYWLAYSWDNLLMSCPSCNINKSTHFELDGDIASFVNKEVNIRNINVSSTIYDAKEQPKMVNPEITEPLGLIQFDRNGKIKSDNPRFKYTIEKCQIDRKSLNDSRRSLLDRFKEHIRDAFIDNIELQDRIIAVNTNIRNFITDSRKQDEEFLAFRRYAIDEDWLNDIVKDKFRN
jgi:uncharacterized protein (TIGR02646 family)